MLEQYKIDGFWSGTHPDAARYSALAEELIPDSDNCDTLEGEFLRAATRIHYDLFNNGWGCNNWSGAVGFLKTYIEHLPKLDMALLDKVEEYSHGEPVPHGNKEWYTAQQIIVTAICEGVIQSITDVRTPNTVDMFDFQGDHYEEEEDEDYYEEEEDYEDDEEE